MKKIIALALCTVMIVTILAGCSCTQNKNAVADGLTKINVDGKTYYSYHDQNANFDNYGLVGYAPGERVILDENFNEVKKDYCRGICCHHKRPGC